ncbi:AAA family ATPase [Pyrrhoderma noxium]|uniref:AAA family ATPase n=1 Tax=Pyrrhoderma noxium TaxID=2282107 RepID=A0A286UWY3_9AGAM|nr:AAA family ATPase [Pyrrhoderma noxium]
MSLSTRTFTTIAAELSEISSSSFRVTRRILINNDLLKNSKVYAGDVIAVLSTSVVPFSSESFCIGVAWPSQDIPLDSICVSTSHMLSANLKAGDNVRVVPLEKEKSTFNLPTLRGIRRAQHIAVAEVDDLNRPIPQKSKKQDWLALYLREVLVDLKYVFVAQKFAIYYEGRKRVFRVVDISEGKVNDLGEVAHALSNLKLNISTPTLWTCGWEVQVTTKNASDASNKDKISQSEHNSVISVPVGYSSVGGLDKQIEQIRDLIEIPLTRPDLFRHFGLKPPKGVLLHGPPGTGKTHLARAVVSASHGVSVLVIAGSELSSAYHGETERRIRDVFAEARARSPCIVVLDEVDALAPRREGSEDGSGGGEVEKRVVATLLTILDGIDEKTTNDGEEERVIVIGTTNRPNAIDPALRRPGRFDREIEIGIPGADARYSIIKVLLAKTPHEIPDAELRSIASRSHGYVGADLSAVVREAGTTAIKRYMHKGMDTSLVLTSEDIHKGLAAVQPSALRSVTLEIPSVRWADIGGQGHVAQKLRECVEWPLRHPEAFTRLGVRAPKGILLYGPPGCSKTLTARALATESGINFLAVKGPELLNKFIGESERAVREIFRKARAAAPSIIFFDEIDALGTSRSGDDGASERHQGVLTTLLNEMDGVQELLGVTILAATNRPDVIDSALMRPGRLDRILYVGPPDRVGRLEILKIRLSKMSVDPDVNLEEIADITEGCSGAELTALCQDAALLTMKENIDAPYIPYSAFLEAARSMRREITPEIIEHFQKWKDSRGLMDV